MDLKQRAWLIRCAITIAIAAGLFLFSALDASASPLGLTTTSPGDITTYSIDVQYNHSTGSLTANGSGDFFYQVLDDTDYFLSSLVFNVSATLNPVTGGLIGGTVDLEGDDLDTLSGVLVQGTLTQFGFPTPPYAPNTNNTPLEFEFNVTGGLLAMPGKPYYNQSGGMILHMFTDVPYFSGVFTSDFHSNIGNSYSDTFPMTGNNAPEPSSIVLLGLGLLPLAWRLRRRGLHPA